MSVKQIHQFYPRGDQSTATFTINALGTLEVMPGGIIDRPLGTDDWLLMWFDDPVILESAGIRAMVPESTMMIWSPDKGHYYGNAELQWNHSWMHVEGEAVTLMLQQSGIPLNTPFQLSSPRIFERAILQMYDEMNEHLKPDPQILINLFANLMISIRRDRSGSQSVVPSKFMKLKQQIDRHYAQPVTLAELAQRVSLSVPHFCNLFKQYFGMPAIEYVIRQRLSHADLLLKDRNRTVADVASVVGYDDVFYFSKLYKRYYGVSPRHAARQ